MKQQLFASISDKGSKKDSISKSTKKKKLSSNGSNKNSKNVDLVRRGLDLTMLSVLIQLPMLSSDEALTDRLLEYVRFDTLKLDLDGQEMEVIDDIDDTFVSSLCATIRLWVRILIANEIGNEKQQQHSDTNKSTAQNGTHKSNAVESSGKTRGKRASSSNASSAGDDDSEAVPEDSYNKSFASNNTVLLNDYHRQRSLNEDMIEMLEIMFQCIHTKGEYLVDAIQFPVSMGAYEGDVLETYRSRLRLTCASSIFELLKLHHISKALTVMQWQVLGWSLLDSNLQNRRLLLSQFGDMIQRNPIHPRFLAYPCLLASSIVHTNNEIQISSSSEYTALYNMAEQYLLFAIKRLRCTQEELSVKASLSTGSHEEIAKLKALAQDHMPEAILPYVLYLLSHHPDFPKSATIVEKEDQLRLKCVIQSIRMIVNALLDSLPGDNSAGNLSLIFKQVNMISQYYKDKLDEDNLGLHFVTQVTTKILKQRIQTVENVQAYPGDIRLPMDLYEAYDNSPLSIDQKAIKTAVLIEAEPAVDKVLGFTITTGHTATRRGGGLARSKPVESKKRVYKADSDDEGALKAKVKKSVNAKAKSKPVPEPPKRPASSRPQRNAAKAVTSYKEQKESDREMMEWDQLAGQEKEEKEARRSRGSAGSNQSLLMPTYHSSNDDSDFSPRKLKQTRLK